MSDKTSSPLEQSRALTEYWSPRVIAEVNDLYIKVAKLKGEFTWHSHDDSDEMFMILEGDLQMELEDRTVALAKGDVYVVPKGVLHNPVAQQECLVMLFERKDTLHTGTVRSNRSRSIAEQLASFAGQ